MTELYDTINRYLKSKDSMNEKAKAEMETKIWDSWRKAGLKKYLNKRDWARDVFNGPSFEYTFRAQLLQAGPWADPLWKLIDEGMSRHSAIRIFRIAKDRVAKEQIQNHEALQQEIDSYNSTGHSAKSQSGKIYRRRTPEEKYRSSVPSSVDVEIDMDIDGSHGTRSKQFMTRIVALADEFLRTSLPGLTGIEDIVIKRSKEEFISFIRESVEDLRRKVSSARQQSKKDAVVRVSRDALREASEVLGVSIVYGVGADLRKAKKIMIRRCAQLHPDKNGPMSDSQKNEYTAVVNAYKTLENYNYMGVTKNEDGVRNEGN